MAHETNLAQVVGEASEALWDGHSGNNAWKMHLVMFIGAAQAQNMPPIREHGAAYLLLYESAFVNDH